MFLLYGDKLLKIKFQYFLHPSSHFSSKQFANSFLYASFSFSPWQRAGPPSSYLSLKHFAQSFNAVLTARTVFHPVTCTSISSLLGCELLKGRQTHLIYLSITNVSHNIWYMVITLIKVYQRKGMNCNRYNLIHAMIFIGV